MAHWRILVMLCVAFVAAACMTGSAHADRTVIKSGDRYQAQTAELEGYKLGVGDKVRVTVFNEPSVSGEFAVSAAGSLSLPLIGDVAVTNKVPSEVAALIQAQLADGYFRNPRVSVEVIAYRPFFILGEVQSPGQYPYVNGLTVLNAIATAQGFTPRAERKTVFIRRADASDEERYELTPALRVLPGDTIRLGERYF